MSFCVVFLFCFCVFCFAQTQEEKLTLTTYYPAPYGAYQQLLTNTLGVGDLDGDGGLDSGDAPNPTTKSGDVWINGSVGIGTKNTSYAKLNVYDPDGSVAMRIETGATSTTETATTHYVRPSQTWLTGVSTSNGYLIRDATGSGTTVFNIEKGAPANSMYINSTGNVGIGTATPASRLTVQGTTTTSAASAFNATNSVGTSLLFVRNDGRVGIGIGAPTGPLHVNGGAASSAGASGSNITLIAEDAYQSSGSENGGNIILEPGSNGPSGGTSGRVGIFSPGGDVTTTPRAPLEIRSIIAIGSFSGAGFKSNPMLLLKNDAHHQLAYTILALEDEDSDGTPTSIYRGGIIMDSSDLSGDSPSRLFLTSDLSSLDLIHPPQLTLANNGQSYSAVGIGIWDPNDGDTNAKLYVNGLIVTSGGLCMCSSREIKKDIAYLSKQDYQDILKKLDKINVANYRWKDQANVDDELHIGIISEEGPDEIVTENKKAVNTTDYLGFLLAAVKAQQEEIEILKKKIETLN